MRTGASAVCSSLGARNSSSVAEPSQISDVERSRLSEPASSCTAGCSCRPALSRGKWRTLTSCGALCVGPARSSPRASRFPVRAGDRWRRACRRTSRPAEARARRRSGARSARHPDRAELLREALEPAAHEREVTVDPDVRAGRDLLAVEHRVDDEEELHVLAARRVEQLGAAIACSSASRRRSPPRGPDRSGAARDRAAARRARPPGRPSTRSPSGRRRNATAGSARARSARPAKAGASSP